MKRSFYLLLGAASVVLAGCSGFGKITEKDFTVTPTPLEYVAGEVPATISANIPAKFMPKKGIVTCTPVLKWDGGQAVGTSKTFQGEKVEANNTVISYKQGGTATMRVAFPYQPEMAKSTLYMQFDAKKGKKEVKIPEVKIGYGVIATPALVSEAARTSGRSIAPDGFQRIISQKQEAAVKFLINQANLRGSELNSSNVKDFIAKMKEIKNDEKGLAIRNVEVSAYASPDGKYAFNEKLAEKRSAESEKYVNKQLKAQQLSTNVDTKYTAEDWDGFKELVAQSNLQDKEVILRVLSMYQDPEQREQEIRNIATVYKELADAVLPELRRSRLTINYDVIGRSDDEIVEQFKNDPSKLSIEEILYAGNTLAQTDAEKETVQFVKSKIDSAKWFIDAIKQRNETLTRTMVAIIEAQRDFFYEGDDSALKPMILQDIAEKTGYDVSTISRVSNSKYVQTEFGIYPLKHFFSEGMQNTEGDEVSTREIKQVLREIIDREDKAHPLNDDELVIAMKKAGYPIARRTVSKYRQQLGKTIARLRKQM